MQNGKETTVSQVPVQLSFEDYINLTAALNRSVTQCAVLAQENERLVALLNNPKRTES